MAGITYTVACLFRDLIFRRLDFFPQLFLFGPPATGKSQLAWSMMYLFGDAQEKFNLSGGTKVGFYRKFAQFCNAVIWFDEYKNAIDYQRVEALKGAYDGSGHEKGIKSQDNRTMTTPVKSGCVISGQDLPTADSALFTRCLLQQFKPREFDNDSYNRLKELEKAGLTSVLLSLLDLRTLFEEQFNTCFDQELDKIKKALIVLNFEAEDRILKNWCVLLTSYQLTRDKLTYPWIYEEFFRFCMDMIMVQTRLISNSHDLAQFWDVVAYLYEMKQISDGKDYCIANKNLNGKPTEVIYLRLAAIHPLYMEAHRKQYNKTGLDKQSLIYYLRSSPEFLADVKSVRFNGDHGINTSALMFDYGKVRKNAQLDNNAGAQGENPGDDSFTDPLGLQKDLPF
jgi:hypothetical protein